MPQMNGFEPAREISKSNRIRLLPLTVQEVSREMAREASKAGSHGAISKGKGSEVVPSILLREVMVGIQPNLFSWPRARPDRAIPLKAHAFGK